MVHVAIQSVPRDAAASTHLDPDLDRSLVCAALEPLPRVAMEPLFTCITCHVGFRLADDQRNHYKSEWHRYNLKRKVADMKPVSQADFELRVQSASFGHHSTAGMLTCSAMRVAAQQAKQEEEEQRSQFVAYCQPCGCAYAIRAHGRRADRPTAWAVRRGAQKAVWNRERVQ